MRFILRTFWNNCLEELKIMLADFHDMKQGCPITFWKLWLPDPQQDLSNMWEIVFWLMDVKIKHSILLIYRV